MKKLFEGSERGDLKRLVIPVVDIDVYSSKMGSDADICVISFTVRGKGPASDLVSFIEKGYNFVLDADSSSGEDDNGDYLVFAELERSTRAPAEIIEIIDDILNLTEQTLDEWRFRYYKNKKRVPLTDENLRKHMFLTPEEYNKSTQANTKDVELDNLKIAAGLDVDTKAPKDELTDSIRIAAGLI